MVHTNTAYLDSCDDIGFSCIGEGMRQGYEKATYEEITKEKYEEMISRIKKMNLDETSDRALG